MKTNKVEATNKIAIKGDRNELIIAAIQSIQINNPELYKELNKVIDYELWDGYPLMIAELEVADQSVDKENYERE